MRAVDKVVLDTLKATGITTYDGLVKVTATNVVNYPTPYLVYYSSVGDDHSRRLTGRNTRRSVYFRVQYVGLTVHQTKIAGERVRAALEGRRLDIPGHRAWLCDLEESQTVRRDDDAIRPDGSPLFYGVDIYSISVTLIPAGAST